MEHENKQKITGNISALVDNLKVEHVIDYLLEQQVLPPPEYEDFVEKLGSSTSTMRNLARRLLLIVINCSNPNCYQVFCDALEKARYYNLLRLLEPQRPLPAVITAGTQAHNTSLQPPGPESGKPLEVSNQPTSTPQPPAIINLDETHGKDAVKKVNQYSSTQFIESAVECDPYHCTRH